MLQPIEMPLASFAPRLAASIRPGPPPVMTVNFACAIMAQFARECIVGMCRWEACRTEDGNTRAHEVEGTKAVDQFAKDPKSSSEFKTTSGFEVVFPQCESGSGISGLVRSSTGIR